METACPKDSPFFNSSIGQICTSGRSELPNFADSQPPGTRSVKGQCISFLWLLLTGYRRLSGLQQQRCILPQFWTPVVQSESHWDETKVRAGPHGFWLLYGETLSLVSSSIWGLLTLPGSWPHHPSYQWQQSWVLLCSIFTWLSPLCVCVQSPASLFWGYMWLHSVST